MEELRRDFKERMKQDCFCYRGKSKEEEKPIDEMFRMAAIDDGGIKTLIPAILMREI